MLDSSRMPFSPKKFRRCAPPLIVAMFFGLMTDSAFAQRRPSFTGERVVVSGYSADKYRSVNQHIQSVEKQSPQTYYAVIVRSSGNSDRAAVQFTDRLYDQWRESARQRNVAFDTERSVIFVLSIQTRKLTVHTGTVLQQKYGLRNQTIDRKLVRPHFIPHARARNYDKGLIALIDKMEKWVADHDRREQQQREMAIARQKQIQQDARTTLATAGRVHSEVLQLIADGDKALDYSAMSTQADLAKNRLSKIEGTIESNAAQALKDATAIRTTLAALRDNIRQMAVNQQAAQQKASSLHQRLGELATLIETQDRAGLTVKPVADRLEKMRDELRESESLINSQPQQALARISNQSNRLEKAFQAAKALPQQKASIDEKFAIVKQQSESIQADLERADRMGVDTTDSKAEIASLNNNINVAETAIEEDYSTTLELLESTEREFTRTQQNLRRAADHRYFITRTVPMWIGIGIAATILAVLILLRILHLLARRPVKSKLASFKTNVVNLSDSLDALKERHRMLPYTDEDFSEPMTGQTLETYDAVSESLEQFRQRWLTLMDIWEKAQHNLDHESFFGRAKLAEASKLIESAPVDDVLQSIQEDCTATLDMLEDAHEQHAATEKELDTALQRLQEQIAAVRDADLATDPYDIELRTALDERDAVVDQRVSDPVHTREVYSFVLSEVRRIGRWTEQILHHHTGSGELEDKLSAVTQEAQEHREQGFRFCEEGSDPNLLFPKIRHHRTECLNLLNTGEAQTAAEHLSQGFGLVASARERIRQQVECREFCQAERIARPQEQERLRNSLQETNRCISELELAFSPDSWDDVVNNIPLAKDNLADCDTLINEASKNGSDEVQFYLAATDQYTRTQKQQNETAALLKAVQQRLAELQALRERARAEIDSVSHLGQQIGTLLRSSDADRQAANHRFRHAESALAQCVSKSSEQRVDWEDVMEHVEFARREFETAGSLAQEDMRLEAQARSEINQAAREIRVASTFYRLGYRAETGTAENEARQAATALNDRDYERAIRMANQAVSSAREAQREADSLARAKQRRIDRRRRERQSAFLHNQSGSNSISIGNSSFGSSGFGSSSSSGSFSSGTSSSSWSSGTSVSSW